MVHFESELEGKTHILHINLCHLLPLLFPAFILNCGELWQGLRPQDWVLDPKFDGAMGLDLGSYECDPQGHEEEIYTPAKDIRWQDPVVNTRWNELKQIYRELYPHDDTFKFNIDDKRVALREILLMRAHEVDNFAKSFRNQIIHASNSVSQICSAEAVDEICRVSGENGMPHLWDNFVCNKCSLSPGYTVSRNGWCQSCQLEQRLEGSVVPEDQLMGFEFTPDSDEAVAKGIAAESWRKEGENCNAL